MRRISPTARARFRSSRRRWIAWPRDGYRLAVCTNKLEWLSVRLLDTLNLTRHFAAICGQDTFGVQKPDPEVLRRTILRAGGEPDRAIMVGDSGTDIRTARAAAVPVIAVDFGYSEVPIATLQPDRLIGSFAELPAAIREIEAARLAVAAAAAVRPRPRRNWGKFLDDQGFIRHNPALSEVRMESVRPHELKSWNSTAQPGGRNWSTRSAAPSPICASR